MKDGNVIDLAAIRALRAAKMVEAVNRSARLRDPSGPAVDAKTVRRVRARRRRASFKILD